MRQTKVEMRSEYMQNLRFTVLAEDRGNADMASELRQSEFALRFVARYRGAARGEPGLLRLTHLDVALDGDR